jgi:hypothetical protein
MYYNQAAELVGLCDAAAAELNTCGARPVVTSLAARRTPSDIQAGRFHVQRATHGDTILHV